MATTPLWTEHVYTIPASHPRGYRRCVRDPKTSRLKLSVKKYVPVRLQHPSASSPPSPSTATEEALTLILHHGMPPAAFKESYEPFLADLLSRSGHDLPPIRAIWAYDDVAFGASYALNKDALGDTHHWHDSARDVLQLANWFAAEMVPPIVGLGQSWGAVAMAMAASWSPGLFAGIILSEPLLENAHDLINEQRALGVSEATIYATHTGRLMAMRRTKWSSLTEAQSSFRRSRLFASYDPRVLSLIYQHEFKTHPDGSVELIPPNAQVTPMFLRPLPALPGYVPNRDEHTILPEDLTFPGLGISQGETTTQGLRSICCHTLILWSTEQSISTSAYKARILSNLGTGHGGAGGKSKGQVDEMTVSGGHSLPYYQPKGTADAVAVWLQNSFWPRWSQELELIKKEPAINSETLSEGFLARLKAASKL